MRAKNSSSKKSGVLLLWALLVYLIGTVCGFILFGGLGVLPVGPAAAAPVGFRVSAPVQALRVQPLDAPDVQTQRQHFADAVAFAAENGYNTLIFEAKPQMAAHWQDGVFPPAVEKIDPLGLLFEAVKGRQIQVWLEVNAYAGTETPGAQGQAAKHLAQSGLDDFSPGDAEYRALVVDSLSALPQRYPVGGIIFTGFDSGSAFDRQGALYCLGLQAMLTDLHTALADSGRLVPLGLVVPESGARVSPGFAAKLAQDGLVSYVLPQMNEGLSHLGRRLSAYGSKGLLPSGNDAGLMLFTARQNPAYAGVAVGQWPQAQVAMSQLAQAQNVLQPVDAPLPAGFELPGLLGISYPAQNATLTTQQVFVMGTSQPGQALLLDGETVTTQDASGLFGVAVPLELGENHFTFSQGERSVTLNLLRQEPEETTASYPADGTSEAKNGQAVVVTELIASALKDPANWRSVNETFPRGATFAIEESLQVKYAGKTTWAYRLPSGDYVLGNHCRLVEGGAEAHFTGLAATPDEKGEWLDFTGTGAPGAYVEYQSPNLLRLTFYNTALEGMEGFTSQMVSGTLVEADDKSVTLQLATQPLWGYSLEYTEDGRMRLYLKKAIEPSGDALRPLQGITVMLDPGHGDTDIGTPGVLWDSGPHEKQINLALAQVVSYRLQQLGATVVMTREDDSFPTLQERLALQIEQKPDFFISIHHNAREPDSDLNQTYGAEGYYFHPYSVPNAKGLAQSLMEQVPAYTGREYRKDAEWSLFYVTRTTVCPSVLYEYGYAMNPAEYADITSTDGLYAAGFATAQAVVNALPAAAPQQAA